MDQKGKIEAMSKELSSVRSRLEKLGPIVLGTLSKSKKKYRTKDGKEHICADSSVLKFSGTGKNLTIRIPKDKEKLVIKLLENGKEWRELQKKYISLCSQLAVYGALKKNCL